MGSEMCIRDSHNTHHLQHGIQRISRGKTYSVIFTVYGKAHRRDPDARRLVKTDTRLQNPRTATYRVALNELSPSCRGVYPGHVRVVPNEKRKINVTVRDQKKIREISANRDNTWSRIVANEMFHASDR